MKRKTLLFFSLLLVALSAGAQTTTLWDATADNVGTTYPNVLSYSSDGTQDGSTLDGENKWFNTGNNQHYMLIKGDAFTATEGATGYQITLTVNYSNGNDINLSSSTSLNGDIAVISTPSGGEQNNVARSATITTAQFTTIQGSGLYLSGVYLNWKKITIEPIMPETPLTISEEVTKRFNRNPNKRASWTPAMRMSDNGYAELVWDEEGNLKYESCRIENGSSYEIPASAFSNVVAGDTLHVLVENCAELNYNATDADGNYKYPDYKDAEVSDGGTGAWAGLRVADGWLAPKQHVFPIKGHFIKVLDYHMVDLIKQKGLRIEGCKFQLDYVVITNGEMSAMTSSDEITVPLYTDETGFQTGNNWGQSPESGIAITDENAKAKIKNGSSEITVTYTSSTENKIQLLAGSGCYGAYQPVEGGAYTSISAATNGTVTFEINSDGMADDIKGNALKLASETPLTITKIVLTYQVERKRIQKEISLDNAGTWEWNVKELTSPIETKDENNGAQIYWGDRIYVEYESAGDAPTATFEGDNKVEGTEITGIRGKFINSNGKRNRWFIYLDYQDAHNLLNLAAKENSPTLKITPAEGATIKAVSILPESRHKNNQPIDINGDLDWTASRVYANIGQVEIGDKITVHTESTGDNPQFQMSVMHRGEKNTKGLAFNELFKFADIYDVLTYSSSDENAREFIDGNPGTYTYTVRSQYMAKQFAKFPLTFAGQQLKVTKVELDSKAFVFDTSIGLDGKPVYWGTMCCSYPLVIPKDGNTHAYIVTGVKDETEDHLYPLTLKEVNNIPAGTPVLISKDENVFNKVADDFTYAVVDNKDDFTADEGVDFSQNLLIGELRGETLLKNDNNYTYYKLTYKENDYPSGAAFFNIAEGGIKAAKNKAYLQLETKKAVKAKAFIFKFEDDGNETTGIEDIKTPVVEKEPVYYNLSGQRISKPTKSGIYICNGRKVMIK